MRPARIPHSEPSPSLTPSVHVEAVQSRPDISWEQRWLNLTSKIRVVEDKQAATLMAAELRAARRGPVMVAFVNAHAMNLAAVNREFYEHLMDADVLLRDGVGMRILMTVLGRRSGLNMNGTDYIPAIITAFRGCRLSLYGTHDTYLAAAAARLQDEGHQGEHIACLDGFSPAEHYLMHAQKFEPDLVVLGMGMPKQEAVAAMLKRQLPQRCTVVCGGAIIDFLGGKVTRAPKMLRTYGMEWLYRLCLEPKRLFERYVVGNPLFLVRAAKTSFRLRKLLRDKK